MQAPGGPTEDPTGGFEEGGWLFKIWDQGVEETLGSLFSGEYDLLLGRRTYDIFAAYWPYAEDENKPMSEAASPHSMIGPVSAESATATATVPESRPNL